MNENNYAQVRELEAMVDGLGLKQPRDFRRGGIEYYAVPGGLFYHERLLLAIAVAMQVQELDPSFPAVSVNILRVHGILFGEVDDVDSNVDSTLAYLANMSQSYPVLWCRHRSVYSLTNVGQRRLGCILEKHRLAFGSDGSVGIVPFLDGLDLARYVACWLDSLYNTTKESANKA